MNTILLIAFLAIEIISIIIGVIISVWFWKNIIKLIKKIIERL